MTLEKETRDAIGRTVRSLRELFEDEFGKQASGRFGIRSSPRGNASDGGGLDLYLDPVESLSLTPAEFAQRDELIHALRYLIGEGHEPGEAVARLIREAAFTAVNRLLAVRVAEAVGVLPPVLSAGRQSAGYRDTVGDLFPILAHDTDSYWIYLQVAGDELAPGVPRLFDRRHPTSAFVPSRACVDEALEVLTGDELAGAWHEPETLGWGYQFFNGDDVKQMRDASSAPRNSRELAVRNQFFTPRYVVDWLVQNTLGRRLVQAGYEIDLPLLVGEIGDYEPLAIEDARVLDPAVGSGHFLLGSYDLLEQAWRSTGVSPEEAATKILPCLFGVEIDPRAAQVAQAVLLLRARRSARSADLTPPTIVTAVALPHSKQLREQAFGDLSPAARHLADEITDALDQAPLLGSLLKVEQRLEAELVSHRTAPRLAVDGSEGSVLEELHRGLDELASKAASPEQRMFTADATDALRLLQICEQRHDVVLMNPPFGDCPRLVQRYIDMAYPASKFDIYAAFVERGSEFLRENGRLGALTNRAGFFIKKAERWRTQIVGPRASHMLDLGYGVLHEAMVEVAAYVVDASSHAGRQTWFRRGLREPRKHQAVLPENLIDETYEVSPEALALIPGSPFSYWVHPSVRQLFDVPEDETVGGVFDVAVGASTKDDFQFLRTWWEVPSTALGTRWRRFAKGGEYAPVVGSIPLVVDWLDGGDHIADYVLGKYPYLKGNAEWVLHRENNYGQAGLTYSRRTTSGFSIRLLPAGSVFSDMGRGVIPREMTFSKITSMLGYGNSRLFRELLDAQLAAGEATQSGTAARAYEASIVGRLPWIELDGIDDLVDALWKLQISRLEVDETSEYFSRLSLDRAEWIELARSAFHAWFEIEARVAEAAGLDNAARSYLSREQGHLEQLQEGATGPVGDEEAITELWTMSMSALIEEAVRRMGPARFLMVKSYGVDRRVELVAYASGASVFEVLEALAKADHLPIDGINDGGQFDRQLSFALGRAFGRWNPLEELSRPGMAGCLDAYPQSALLRLPDPTSNVLTEDASRSDDVGVAVQRVLTDELGVGTDERTLRDYIRSRFFAAHLKQYSASRRYAPIYWQLAVPSKRWGLWLYAPSLSRENLFAIARAAREKLASLNEQVSLARERSESDRDAQERAESLEDLAAEVEKFAAIADEVAQSGWEPDLNDGLVLNAAPLEELFVDKKWRGQIAKHRKAMQKGDYPWATVQREYFEKRA